MKEPLHAMSGPDFLTFFANRRKLVRRGKNLVPRTLIRGDRGYEIDW